CLQDAQLPLTF
nr:immunoglobulin light chain junction region [Macaca mulatta]MOV34751.1 immunoglobulin light chain junction region [Macaca mulatta]MOV34941.1 immunoglobulin light chain junction region [Macaca mulatta]MOV35477.1 immunoglobulin light chain junction region [Macaca mulatta]